MKIKISHFFHHVLIFQLLWPSSITLAQDTNSTTAEKISKGIQSVTKGVQTVKSVIQVAQPFINPQAVDPALPVMMELQKMRQPQPDKYFDAAKLSQLPGMMDYLQKNGIHPSKLSCQTLMTKISTFDAEVCREGIHPIYGSIPEQLRQVQMLDVEYNAIINEYKIYLRSSNQSGQQEGVGCMNNAMNILNGYFKSRLDQLNNLTTKLEFLDEQFKKNTEPLLNGIEKNIAILDGGNSDIVKKVNSQDPTLLDFKKRFDNPSCGSIFAGDDLQNKGKKGGLKSIRDFLTSQSAEKKGDFSAETYLNSHSQLLNEVNNLAQKAGKNVRLNFSSVVRGDLKDLTTGLASSYNLNKVLNPGLFQDQNLKLKEELNRIKEKQNSLTSELNATGINSQKAISLLSNLETANFKSEVQLLERNIKNKCLNDTIKRFGGDQILNKIIDPNSSRHANQHGNNLFKSEIKAALENKDFSIERKLKELEKIEKSSRGRYYLKLNTAYTYSDEINGKIAEIKVPATKVNSPVTFYKNLIKNCETQFKRNNLNNNMSGKKAIQELYSLKKEYKKLAKKQEEETKETIRTKLIECENPEVANNTQPGSCSSKTFDNTSAGFCLKAAFSCAKKMRDCKKQAETYVQRLETQKTNLVNNYQSLAKTHIKNIQDLFDRELNKYMIEGDMFRGLFGAGFSSPTGRVNEVSENDQHLKSFAQAGTLLLSPEKYLENFRKNVSKLKKSVEDQQNQILGGNDVSGSKPGLLENHIKQTEKNYNEVIKDAEKYRKQCADSYSEFTKKQRAQSDQQQEALAKQMGERNQDLAKFCQAYSLLQSNPNGACGENFMEITTNVMQVVGNDDYVTNYYQLCSQNSEESIDVIKFCAKNPQVNKCAEYMTCLKNSGTSTTEEGKTTTVSCDGYEKILEVEIRAKNNDLDPETLIGTPPFCFSGENSGREVPGKSGPNILDDLTNAVKALET